MNLIEKNILTLIFYLFAFAFVFYICNKCHFQNNQLFKKKYSK